MTKPKVIEHERPTMTNVKRLKSQATEKTLQTTKPTMKKIWSDRIIIETTEEDIYLVLDGVRMAKRGKPGTPEQETWIYLKPGSPERRARFCKKQCRSTRICPNVKCGSPQPQRRCTLDAAIRPCKSVDRQERRSDNFDKRM